jgi:tetratricopeptide (TPR) repeat protein
MTRRCDRVARASGAKRTLGLAVALLACVCATAQGLPSAAVAGEGAGFTVREKVRVSGGVRADFERAVALLRDERYEEGIALLAEVTAAAPNLTAAHLDLAMAYQRVGDLARAEASALQALRSSPQHPVAHNELGMIQRKTGRYAEARRSYEQALALQPSFHYARLNLAILCDLYLADADCALEQYELYAKSAPDDPSVEQWIAELRSRM